MNKILKWALIILALFAVFVLVEYIVFSHNNAKPKTFKIERSY